MVRFGEFKDLCAHSSSYALCNLFYLQLQRSTPDVFMDTSQRPSAPVGINPECGIPKLHTEDSMSNVANNVLCGVGFIITAILLWGCQKRIAAVGRVEFRALLVTYLVSLLLQILTAGALLEQGTQALGALTAIHTGVVASLFWVVFWNALVTTQLLDDGRALSVTMMHLGQFILFLLTMYISLDTAFGFSSTFGSVSNPPESIRSVPLFVLLNIWPGAAVLISMAITAYIVIHVLRETRPFWIYLASTIAFAVAQVFRLSPIGISICETSNSRVDGSFIATFLETVAIVIMYYGWADITKASWDEAL